MLNMKKKIIREYSLISLLKQKRQESTNDIKFGDLNVFLIGIFCLPKFSSVVSVVNLLEYLEIYLNEFDLHDSMKRNNLITLDRYTYWNFRSYFFGNNIVLKFQTSWRKTISVELSRWKKKIIYIKACRALQ